MNRKKYNYCFLGDFIMTDESKDQEKTQFRKVPADPNQRGLKKKLSMIQNFASSLASRNFNNNKINNLEKFNTKYPDGLKQLQEINYIAETTQEKPNCNTL